MPLFLFAALVIAILAVVFAVQNAIPITVTFFSWKFEGSLALVLLLTLALGVVTSLLVSLPAMIKRSWVISQQKKRIEDLEKSAQEMGETPESPPREEPPPISQ